MTRFLLCLCGALFWLSATLLPTNAQNADVASTGVADGPLRVATYPCPPFVYRDAAGAWTGLGIQFWEETAAHVGIDFTYEERALPDLLSAAETGDIDIGVSCISITPEREERVDFSHSIYQTHLSIAVRETSLWTAIGNVLIDPDTLRILGVVVLVAGLVGAFYYLLEHRVNAKLYTRQTALGRAVEGFVLGLLFITRGPFNYYEFKTLTGRVMTVLLAVATTIFVASFTAVLASAFTLDRLRSDITSPADLSGLRVGVKEAATSARYLDRLGISYRGYATVTDMLQDLQEGRLDAVVADDPVLRFEIKLGREAGTITTLNVLPYQFERQNYGLVFRDDPEFHEEIDRALLVVKDSDVWAERIGQYLGIAR